MNFTSLLLAPAPKPLGSGLYNEKKKVGNRNNVAANKAKMRKSEMRYRPYLLNVVLTTPELANMMGCHPSNITKTLKTMEIRGVVKCLGATKRVGGHGRAPVQWTWCGE